MKKYSFVKNDGMIKKNYIDVCKDILASKIQHHVITVGRYNDIVEEYDSYSFIKDGLLQPKRRQYENKVKEIVNHFRKTNHTWRSGCNITFNFNGVDYDLMKIKLENLLKITKEAAFC